jgi:hypothetical protein
MDSATLNAHFDAHLVKFINLKALEKMDSPNFPYAQRQLLATPELLDSAALSAHF